MSGPVLDASAVLAWLQDEAGAERVDAVLHEGVLSAVNASEIAQKLTQHGADGARVVTQVLDLGLVLTPFTVADALAAAALWPTTRAAGLSLGDRACLATAQRLNRPVLTADLAWKNAEVDVDIQFIR